MGINLFVVPCYPGKCPHFWNSVCLVCIIFWILKASVCIICILLVFKTKTCIWCFLQRMMYRRFWSLFCVMFPMLIQWEAIKIKYFIMLGKKATKSGLTKMWWLVGSIPFHVSNPKLSNLWFTLSCLWLLWICKLPCSPPSAHPLCTDACFALDKGSWCCSPCMWRQGGPTTETSC